MKSLFPAFRSNRSSTRNLTRQLGVFGDRFRPAPFATASSSRLGDGIDRLWDQSLLDRLQSPLTRRRD